MRYYPRAPLSPTSPSYLVGLSSQRSKPTCSLSLANVSASATTSCSSEAQQDAMEIDSLDTLVPVMPTDKRCTVPFPKRPHSLLRSTPSGPRPHATNASGDRSGSSTATQQMEEEDSEILANDQDLPRKRTRTSAISTSTRTRPRRVASLPSPPLNSQAQSSAAIVEPPTPVLPLPSPNPSPIPVEFPVSSSSSSSSQSCSQPSSSHVPSPNSSSVSFPSGKANSNARAPTWSTSRRRRASPEEAAASVRLYKMLLSGLAAKYGDHHDRGGTSSATAYLNAVLKDTRTYFDVQDALLVQRLRTWLVINGVDMRQVSIEIEIENEPETYYPGDTPMVIDDIAEHIVSNAVPPQEIETSKSTSTSTSPQFVMTYQRHVASTLLRHRNQPPSRLRGKNSSKRSARQASSLAVEL